MNIISKARVSLYNFLVRFHAWKYRKFYGMDIGEGTIISRKAVLDRGINPRGIHVGQYTRVTGGVVLLAHDACRKMKGDVIIGDNCFIGNYAVILPGVTIGNECIIGAGSIVTKDIPNNCIAAGNPARVIKEGIVCDRYGVLKKK